MSHLWVLSGLLGALDRPILERIIDNPQTSKVNYPLPPQAPPLGAKQRWALRRKQRVLPFLLLLDPNSNSG